MRIHVQGQAWSSRGSWPFAGVDSAVTSLWTGPRHARLPASAPGLNETNSGPFDPGLTRLPDIIHASSQPKPSIREETRNLLRERESRPAKHWLRTIGNGNAHLTASEALIRSVMQTSCPETRGTSSLSIQGAIRSCISTPMSRSSRWSLVLGPPV